MKVESRSQKQDSAWPLVLVKKNKGGKSACRGGVIHSRTEQQRAAQRAVGVASAYVRGGMKVSD
jgi:hypothetical protein